MDTRLQLALALADNPGVYALLLGSGTSRAAGIPTGWEIVGDLIRRLATAAGQRDIDDPIGWYQTRLGEPPAYSSVIRRLARTQAERQALLRAYFEPTEVERQDGLKLPTAAHRAIARLVRQGRLRVVVTTNFDRLLELALEEEGIRPVVIANEDAARGAIPTSHAECLLLKLHGDYLDTRIRNTEDELERYPKPLRDRLDQILSDYGLIVCGWSGDWDPALRGAIERAGSRRYSTFWAARGKPTDIAERLIRHRDAVVVPIGGADEFFEDVADRVASLLQSGEPHPKSVTVAENTLKRFLADPVYRIRLHDFVANETETAARAIADPRLPMTGAFNASLLAERVAAYESALAILGRLVSIGAYWCEPDHVDLWTRSIERIANPEIPPGGNEAWLQFRRYPALYLVYCAGVGAVRQGRYELVRALLLDVDVRDSYHGDGVFATAAALWRVLRTDWAQLLPGMERRQSPLSDWLQAAIREHSRELVPSDETFVQLFDTWEYLFCLVSADLHDSVQEGRRHGPVGSFGWRWQHGQDAIARRLREEAEQEGDQWPVVASGLFGGSAAHFLQVHDEFGRFWPNQSRF